DPAYRRRIEEKVPMPNCRDRLQWLVSRRVAIFYVSARRADRLDQTTWWLAHNGFPPGAGIYLSDNSGDAIAFKVGIIERLTKDYNILFGVGDRDSDMEAYRRGGVAALHVNQPSDWLALDRQIREIVDAASVEKPSGLDITKRLFASKGRNQYFVLEPGFRTVLEGKGKKMTITVLDDTKLVAGITTRVVEEKEEKDGKITEISRNYYAICLNTTEVFYFGEDVDVYRGGQVVSHEGSWLAGEDKAQASLFLPGQPAPGMKYLMEESPGKVMDRAEILGLSETAATPAGIFTGCLEIRESSDLNVEENGIQIFASGIGLIQEDDLSLVQHGFGDGVK
ncbi:MAG: hypothetical protein NTV79_02750, partial [Candidatus Aureabacteria bacterium]|nr:hypothetical protein [Candidatus Auribacterota bacterium]